MNLYSILGIKEDASEEQIKRAYRKLSKKFHPDKNDGVQMEDFLNIKKAYEVLMDKDRRRIYDETGDIIEKKAEHQIINLVAGMIVNIISDKNVDLVHNDVVDIMKKIVNQNYKNFKNNISINDEFIGRYKILGERLKNQDSFMKDFIKGNIEHHKKEIRKIKENIEIWKRVEKFINKYGYDVEQMVVITYSEFGTSTTATSMR